MTTPRVRSLAVAVAALGAARCGETIQPTYDISLIAPADVDPFEHAARVVLDAGGARTITAAVRPGQPFDLRLAAFAPAAGERAAFHLRALDAADNLVAYGESPAVDLALSNQVVRILVQPPGTFGQWRDGPINPPFVGHFAVPSSPAGSDAAAVLFGLGTAQQTNEAGELRRSFFAGIGIYDPVQHAVVDAGLLPPARADVAALALADGRVLVFGGDVVRDTGIGPTADVDVLRLAGRSFGRLVRVVELAAGTDEPGVARAGAALAAADLAYAFGGRAGQTPLDSVVRLDTSQHGPAVFALLAARMSAPRLGHTATAVKTGAENGVLVFGGAPDDKPVAELFETAPAAIFAPLAGAGPPRSGHAALTLPDDRVLVVGGRGPGGAPLADAVIYSPGARSFAVLPALLRTPRADAVAFVVQGDVVVAGGVGADGAAVGSAEIFDAVTLAFIATTDAVARSRATATSLPNAAALILGGQAADGTLSGAVEIYQPRRS